MDDGNIFRGLVVAVLVEAVLALIAYATYLVAFE